MKLRCLMFALLLLAGQAVAEEFGTLMRVQDADGYTNVREGPSTEFPVLVKNGEVVRPRGGGILKSPHGP